MANLSKIKLSEEDIEEAESLRTEGMSLQEATQILKRRILHRKIEDMSVNIRSLRGNGDLSYTEEVIISTIEEILELL